MEEKNLPNMEEELDDDLDFDYEAFRQEEQAREEREKQCAELLEADRALNGPAEITPDKVIAGLKFIMENPDISQVELVTGLLELGCNFNWDEFHRRFPEEALLFPGMKWGNLACGTSVLINMRDSETWRHYLHEHLFEAGNGRQIRWFIFVAKIRSTLTRRFLAQ